MSHYYNLGVQAALNSLFEKDASWGQLAARVGGGAALGAGTGALAAGEGNRGTGALMGGLLGGAMGAAGPKIDRALARKASPEWAAMTQAAAPKTIGQHLGRGAMAGVVPGAIGGLGTRAVAD